MPRPCYIRATTTTQNIMKSSAGSGNHQLKELWKLLSHNNPLRKLETTGRLRSQVSFLNVKI